MSLREEQCKKVCRILDDVLANRPTERDSLIVAVQLAFEALSEPHWIPVDLENNKPPLEEWVFVSSDGYVMQDCIVERGGKKIWYHGGNIQSDDRYMPLPEPYKGVTDGTD